MCLSVCLSVRLAILSVGLTESRTRSPIRFLSTTNGQNRDGTHGCSSRLLMIQPLTADWFRCERFQQVISQSVIRFRGHWFDTGVLRLVVVDRHFVDRIGNSVGRSDNSGIYKTARQVSVSKSSTKSSYETIRRSSVIEYSAICSSEMLLPSDETKSTCSTSCPCFSSQNAISCSTFSSQSSRHTIYSVSGGRSADRSFANAASSCRCSIRCIVSGVVWL